MSDFSNTIEVDGLHIITLPSVLDLNNVEEFEKAVAAWLETQFPIHIFDFKNVVSLRRSFYRPLFCFHKEIKLQHKQIKSVNVQKELLDKLKVEGLLAAMSPIANLEEAAKLLKNGVTRERIKLDAEFINPFIEATRNFLVLQANLEITAGKPILKPVGEFNLFDIGGQIRIENNNFIGSVVIHFHREVFFRILQAVMGSEKINEESLDAEASAGEILNIIFGQAKAALNEKLNLGLAQGLPAILVGESLKIHEKVPAVVIPFQSAFGNFFLEIGFVSRA